MRWFFEFETTTCPACANARSISVATDASMAENKSCGAVPGFASSTVIAEIAEGVVAPRCHFAASE